MSLPPARRVAYGPDEQQVGDLYRPAGDGPHPVVLLVHGGYWRARYDRAYLDPVARTLAAAGLAVWSIEYRRTGQEGGGWPGTFLDVADASDYLRTLDGAERLDLARVVTVGHSAGGQLALWLAARAGLPPASPLHRPDPLPLRAVVALAPLADLRWASEQRLGDGGDATDLLMGGNPAERPERYHEGSPIERLPLGLPQLLIHGLDDHDVPPRISQRYHDAARAAGDPVRLVTLPGVDHFAPVEPGSAAWPVVRSGIERMMR